MVADAKYQIFPHKPAKIQKHEEINLMHKGLHQKRYCLSNHILSVADKLRSTWGPHSKEPTTYQMY